MQKERDSKPSVDKKPDIGNKWRGFGQIKSEAHSKNFKVFLVGGHMPLLIIHCIRIMYYQPAVAELTANSQHLSGGPAEIITLA